MSPGCGRGRGGGGINPGHVTGQARELGGSQQSKSAIFILLVEIRDQILHFVGEFSLQYPRGGGGGWKSRKLNED